MRVNIKGIKEFARGRRSVVYVGFYKGKKVIVKKSLKRFVDNEARYLKILNKYNIGPKFLFRGDDYLVYEFVNGKRILDFFKEASKKEKYEVIRKIFEKLRIMDKLGINKKEMHKPIKHIFVSRDVKMIDFERCYRSGNVKNVTQFCEFLRRVFKIDNDFVFLLKKYKKSCDDESYEEILRFFKEVFY